MQKITVILLLLLFSLNKTYGNKNTNDIQKPTVKFDSLWVEHNVTENNMKGMKIHVYFRTFGLKNKDINLMALFYYDDIFGDPLFDENEEYTTLDGTVAVFRPLKPQYDSTVFKNYALFMPYSEFHLDTGKHELAFEVEITDLDENTIGSLTSYSFSYTKTGNSSIAPSNANNVPTINIIHKEMAVEYDVFDNNQKGLKVHFTFSTEKMKDTEGYIAVYFTYKDGSKVLSNNENYKTQDGQLALFRKIKPSYDAADFKDIILFMPYDKIPGTGKIDMKMNAKIIKPDGTILKSLDEKGFQFTR